MDDIMNKDYSSFSNNIIFDNDNDERENTFIGDKNKKQQCCKKIGNLIILLKIKNKYVLSIGPDCKFISYKIRYLQYYNIYHTYCNSFTKSYLSL